MKRHSQYWSWVKPIERGLYLCDAEGATLHVIEPGIHAPAFDFTAYISWDGFRTHESLLLMADWESEEIGPVLDAARQALRTHFRQRRDEQRRDVVQQWKEEAVYPYSSDPDTAVQQANQAIFNYVAVSAEHALNSISDPTAKRFSLNAIKVAVEADPSSLELVMKEVLALPVEKLDEFREILERTSLASVIAAVKTVTDRLEFLAGLETLIFDPTVAVETLERAHLHRILENEPWLFGRNSHSTSPIDRSPHCSKRICRRSDVTTSWPIRFSTKRVDTAASTSCSGERWNSTATAASTWWLR